MDTQFVTTTTYNGYKIMSKSRVLFIGAGNSVLSQMAEAFLRWFAADYFEVFSGGLKPAPIHPMTIQVMEELGINMSQHSSKSLSSYNGAMEFANLITVSDFSEKECPYFPGSGARIAWKFENPARVQGTEEEQLAAFRRVRDQVEAQILDWLADQGVLVAK